MAQSGVAFETS